jgi:hypothetical protein
MAPIYCGFWGYRLAIGVILARYELWASWYATQSPHDDRDAYIPENSAGWICDACGGQHALDSGLRDEQGGIDASDWSPASTDKG